FSVLLSACRRREYLERSAALWLCPSMLSKGGNLVMLRLLFGPVLFASIAAAHAYGDDMIAKIAPGDFDRLLADIKPQLGESPWLEIRWLTNVTEARRLASAQDKPIVIFTAADGSPLSRT